MREGRKREGESTTPENMLTLERVCERKSASIKTRLREVERESTVGEFNLSLERERKKSE